MTRYYLIGNNCLALLNESVENKNRPLSVLVLHRPRPKTEIGIKIVFFSYISSLDYGR